MSNVELERPEPEAPPQESDAHPVENAEAEQQQPEGDGQQPREERGRVDFKTASPEVIEARFNRMYRQVKESEARERERDRLLRDMHDRLAAQETGQRTERLGRQKAQVEADMSDAFEKGDSARAAKLQRELVELEIEARAPATVKSPAPVEQPQPSAEAAWVPQDDMRAISEWSAKRDYAKGGEYQQWTAAQIYDLYAHPKWQGRTVQEKLAEVDRRYRAETQPATAQVLAPNANRRPPDPSKTKLSEAQRQVAYRIFPDKTKAEAEAEYAKGVR